MVSFVGVVVGDAAYDAQSLVPLPRVGELVCIVVHRMSVIRILLQHFLDQTPRLRFFVLHGFKYVRLADFEV